MMIILVFLKQMNTLNITKKKGLNMKRKISLFLLVCSLLMLVGCNANNTSEISANETPNMKMENVEKVANVDDLAKEKTKEEVHKHIFVYENISSTKHNVVCEDKTCDYVSEEDCVFNEDYVCDFCKHKCEHTISYTSNEDGTHDIVCSICNYIECIPCSLNENYICDDCEWIHEHDFVVAPDEKGTHVFACTYSCCNYSSIEDCEYVDKICTSCGGIYPWEKDITYFDNVDVYYAQKELNVYISPNINSEVVKTLAINDSVRCIGSIFYGSGANYERYFVTEEGYCILNKFNVSTSRNDMRICKTSQVIVRTPNESLVYNSYDDALENLCGCSWSNIKQTWTYNDYKSQGLPFMNTYNNSSLGITISTKDGVNPYGYNCNGVDYYFE